MSENRVWMKNPRAAYLHAKVLGVELNSGLKVAHAKHGVKKTHCGAVSVK